MTAGYAGTLLILLLPFLLSLAGQPGTPKLLCLAASMLALLLSLDVYPAILPWTVGMAIALISLRERFDRRRSI